MDFPPVNEEDTLKGDLDRKSQMAGRNILKSRIRSSQGFPAIPSSMKAYNWNRASRIRTSHFEFARVSRRELKG